MSDSVATLIDAANVLFTVANLPQVIEVFRNRKVLKGLSKWTYLLYVVGSILFLSAFFLIGAGLSFFLGCFNLIFYAWVLFWVVKKEWREKRILSRSV